VEKDVPIHAFLSPLAHANPAGHAEQVAALPVEYEVPGHWVLIPPEQELPIFILRLNNYKNIPAGHGLHVEALIDE
jgi:hypothetical protein